MHRRHGTSDMQRCLRWTICLVVLASGCADTEQTFTDGGAPQGCTEGKHRCQFDQYQSCVNGGWQTEQECRAGNLCLVDHGCVACDPTAESVCHDGNVHTCKADGTIGELLTECLTETCESGKCGGKCPTITKLIYVIDRDKMLRTFDPRNDAHVFADVTKLDCPANKALSGWVRDDPTPFAMTIDRKGRAWVQYTSGEVFTVDLETGASAFIPSVIMAYFRPHRFCDPISFHVSNLRNPPPVTHRCAPPTVHHPMPPRSLWPPSWQQASAPT
jgi:hypothetical protein